MRIVLAAALAMAVGSAHAAGDADKGKKVFNKCKACHAVGDGAKNKVGPALNGIVGAPFGAVDGFRYSRSLMDLAAQGKVWDDATLDAYLKKPKDVVPRGRMAFAGLKKEEDRLNVIAYLYQFSK